MKGIFLVSLIIFLYLESSQSIVFNCSTITSDGLVPDSSLDNEFMTNFEKNYYTPMMSFNVPIRVEKSAGYDGSNVKGVYFSTTFIDNDGNLTSMNYGTFPIINPVTFDLYQGLYRCYEGTWPGDINAFWGPGSTWTHPDTIRVCVSIVTSLSPPTGYMNCQNIRMAKAVTKPTVDNGRGVWNGDIDLYCMVSVFPQPQFKWYYNGAEIVEGDHYSLVNSSLTYLGDNDYQYTLSVKGARPYDTIFSYHCSVTNILQTTELASDPAHLTIIYLNIELLNSPESTVNGFIGRSIVINCTFASYPTPSIIWKKNGIQLTNSSRICIIPGYPREDPVHGIIFNSRLAFTSLEHSDASNYTCEAMRAGSSMVMTHTFKLDIIAASNITSISPDSVGIVNMFVSLSCLAEGVPPPSIKWYNSANMEISTTSSVSVRVMSAGVNTWTCEASNDGGVDTATVTVTGYFEAAAITSAPRDTTVDYRERASFVCVVTGNPTPVVNWYFTSYSVGASEENLNVNNTVYTVLDSMLLIQKATLAEQGTYRCEAVNVARYVTASATLTIQQVRPSVQIRPVSKEVVYNTLLSISCISLGMPSPTQKIVKPDGSKVNSPYVIVLFTENYIGTYHCIATSPLNGEVAVQSATFSLPGLEVSVTPATLSVDKSSSNAVVFTCTVSGSPTFSSMKWYHQNQCSDEMTEIMNADQGYLISANLLTIAPNRVTRFLPGLYICLVERFSSNFSGSASLSLSSEGTVDVSPLTDFNCIDLSSGQTRQFVCGATSNLGDPITYSWSRNKDQVNPGSISTTININSNGYGNYRCVATAEQVCNFTDSAVNGGLTVSIYPDTISVDVGERFTIHCNGDGFPTLIYTWYKNGVLIPGQNNPTYTIIAATIGDIGTYTCSVYLAACPATMNSSGCIANVLEGPPAISTMRRDYNLVIGNPMILSCQATGVPTPNYQWYKDQVAISNEVSDYYLISSASEDDTGLYACEAVSYISRSFQNISKIVVYQAPENIQLTGVPIDPVDKGKEITLMCTAIAVPPAQYEWMDSNSNIIGNTGVLTVIIQRDSGYTCTASNGWGFVEDSVSILVKVAVVNPQGSDLTTTVVIPATMGGLAVVTVCVMTSLICVLCVMNYRRVKRSKKGVIAEDSNVLLAEQLVHNNITNAPDEMHSLPSISSEGSKDSIDSDVIQEKVVEKSGGLDRSKPLTPAKLQELILTVQSTGGTDGDNELCQEFESIPSNMAKWTTMPKDSEVKNRYMNVLPNADTMVEISDTGEIGSTFINANYITDYKLSNKNTYIATQGPLPSTIADFWRMVWENDVRAVVMTCQLVERKRIRCARYWPDTNLRPTEIYGSYKVSIDSFAKTDDYEICILYVSYLKAGANEIQKKQVYHYWYKAWPSFGVPQETTKIWKFLKEVHTNAGDALKPLLFHCSAGIGRTAVFIGIDMGMHEYKNNSEVDPLKYLCNLRKGRGGSIQTPEQYFYMHRVLQDFILAQTNK